MIEWIETHWTELLTALGIGGGSGAVAKKLVDRKQNTRLKEHEVRINDIDKKIIKIEADLDKNTENDHQLRTDLKEHREMLDKRLSALEEGQKRLTDHIIDFIKSIK